MLAQNTTNKEQFLLEDEKMRCVGCQNFLSPSRKDADYNYYYCESCKRTYKVPNKDSFKEYRKSLHNAINKMRYYAEVDKKDELPEYGILHEEEFASGDVEYLLYEYARLSRNFTKISNVLKSQERHIEAAVESDLSYPLDMVGCEIEADYNAFKKKIAKKKESKKKFTLTMIILSIILVVAAAVASTIPNTSTSTWSNGGITVTEQGSFVDLIMGTQVNLTVENKKLGTPEYAVAYGALNGTAEKFELLDINLTKNGEAYEIDGSLHVTVSVPDGYRANNVSVYYISPTGMKEELAITVSTVANTVSFNTTHFSLYAICEKPYIVKINDGVNDEKNFTALWGDLITEPEMIERVGYTFGGWYNGDKKWYFAVDPVVGDTEIVAKWIPNKYTVTYDATEGSLTGPETQIVTFGADETLMTPYLYGYRFKGWYDSDGNKYENGEWSHDGDVSVSARWEIGVYEIILDYGGGTVTGESQYNLKVGEEIVLPTSSTRVGYTFDLS